MSNDLSPQDLACLNECRAVAIENCRFYDGVYNQETSVADKRLIGSVAAQKKVFVEAMSAILHSSDELPAKIGAHQSNGLVLELPPLYEDKDSFKQFRETASQHEAQFEKAINVALEFINDATTREVLVHHKNAAQISTKALIKADILDKG